MKVEMLDGAIADVPEADAERLIELRKARPAPPPEPKRRSFRGTP